MADMNLRNRAIALMNERPGAISYEEAILRAAGQDPRPAVSSRDVADHEAEAQRRMRTFGEPRRRAIANVANPQEPDSVQLVDQAQAELERRGIFEGSEGYYPALKREVHELGGRYAADKRQRQAATFGEGRRARDDGGRAVAQRAMQIMASETVPEDDLSAAERYRRRREAILRSSWELGR